jgi:hypothetical protein
MAEARDWVLAARVDLGEEDDALVERPIDIIHQENRLTEYVHPRTNCDHTQRVTILDARPAKETNGSTTNAPNPGSLELFRDRKY